MGTRHGSSIDVPSTAAAPVVPAGGYVSVYAKEPNGAVFGLDAAGVETMLSNVPFGMSIGGEAAPTYFDGDTPDTGTDTYNWTGTPHLSTSEHWVVGDDLAPRQVNMATIPSGEAGIGTPPVYWHSNTAFGGAAGMAAVTTTTFARYGTQSIQVTWANHPTLRDNVILMVDNLVKGKTYSASLWVYVPTGSPDVALDILYYALGEPTGVKNTWVRLSTVFTVLDDQPTRWIGANIAPNAPAGSVMYLDGLLVVESSSELSDTLALNFTGDGVQVTAPAADAAVATIQGVVAGQPAVRVYKSADQNLTNGGTLVGVTFDTVQYSVPPTFADAANNQLVIPEDGLYSVTAYVIFKKNGTTGSNRTLYLTVNDQSVRAHRMIPETDADMYLVVSTSQAMRAGDRIEAIATQSSSNATLSLVGGTNNTALEAALVGPYPPTVFVE